MIVIIFSLFFYKIFKNKILFWSYKIQEEEDKYLQTLQEGIGSIRDIFILGASKFFIKRFDKINFSIKKNGVPLSLIPDLSRHFLEIVMIFVFVSIMIYKTILGIDGREIALFISVIALAMIRILPSANKILTKYQLLNNMSAPVEIAIREFYDNEIKTFKDNEIEMINDYEEIELKNITFGYDKINIVLKNLNLNIKKGQFIGIYGESGSGKSTLVDLISGLLKPDTGKIYIDKNYDNKRLKISYISQLNYLIDDTILSNITFEDNEKNKF